MNYEGYITSVNTILWTFEVDNKVTVHMGHLSAQDKSQLLPEIGEKIKLSNAHYKLDLNINTLFLCEQSFIKCKNYKDYARDDALITLIEDFNFGVSDLLEIDYNIGIIEELIKPMVHQSCEQIILEVTRRYASGCAEITLNNDEHRCLNKILPSFTLKSISSCRYIDLDYVKHRDGSGPPWSFGTHSKRDSKDVLIGYLKTRSGIIVFSDSKYTMRCIISNKEDSLDRNSIMNQFVLIKHYRIFTEHYREENASNLEYILFDIKDVIVLLDLESVNLRQQSIFCYELPVALSYVYNFEFKLLKKAWISFDRDFLVECWLDILVKENDKSYCAYLALVAHQVEVAFFLEENRSYQVYHFKKLMNMKNPELNRLKLHSVSWKFNEKNPVFIPEDNDSNKEERQESSILNVREALTELKEKRSEFISFQGILNAKKLTPSLASRTQKTAAVVGFGTPGTKTHTLEFIDDLRESSLTLYLNNWEKMQIPLGLILDMRIYVRYALPQKQKYLKSCAFTTFEILGYEPPVQFDTVNLSSSVIHDCDKYSFLGFGDLIPCNVLIWAQITELYIRSLKIVSKCQTCDNITSTECSCTNKESVLETTITLKVADTMGQSLVISKSKELLRLLLDIEPKQWDIWCVGFKSVGLYTHDFVEPSVFSNNEGTSSFCNALFTSIKLINVMKISDVELKCRKMEYSKDDNEGMPKWYCVEARKKQESF